VSDTRSSEGAQAEPDEWGESLPRQLGTFSAVTVLVGSTIASGLFASPAEIARSIDQLPLFALAWVLGGLVALCGALTLAELASLFPRSGGLYVFIREAFGGLPAFLFGWAELLILRPAAYGAIAIVSAEYMWVLVETNGGPAGAAVLVAGLTRVQLTAAVFIIITGGINYRGIKLGALIQDWSTIFKVGALLAIVMLGFVLTPGEVPDPAGARTAARLDRNSLSAFGVAMVSVLWAYDGWSDVGFVSGEVKNPRKALPRAFILGTLIVVILYLLANAVYLKVVPITDLHGRPLIAADVTHALFGPAGATFVSAAVMVSTFGTLNGSMMTGPRVFFAMAEDGLFFRGIGKVHPEHGTPGGAILLSIGLGVVFVAFSTFGELADQFVIGIWPFYALAVAAVFKLRKSAPVDSRDAEVYRTWGYPLVPLVFLGATAFLLGNYAISETRSFFGNFGVIATGIPVYYWWSRQKDSGV
jgi:amino acid transporter